MSIVINGSGSITGLAVGGLPDGTVDAGTLATNSVDSAELIDGAVDNSHMAAMAASKLTGALPAISGASLTGLKAGTAAFAARNTGSTWNAVDTGDILGFNNDSTGDSYDTDGVYNTSTYKFTAPAAGVYIFYYCVYTAQNDASNAFGFLKNSTAINVFTEAGGRTSFADFETGDHVQTATIVVTLASGDTMAVIGSLTGTWYTGISHWGGCRLA